MNIHPIILRAVGFFALTSAMASAGCSPTGANAGADATIYASEEFTVYTDSVVQGGFKARALSPWTITTDYRSPQADGMTSGLIRFRLSLNSRDNELPSGREHLAVVTAPDTVYTFGVCAPTEVPPEAMKQASGSHLAPDTPWRLRVDMTPVLRAMRENGFYVTPTDDTIHADDFKGVWIAGGTLPLKWEFENLYARDDRRLRPAKGAPEGIYEITLTLNPASKPVSQPSRWSIDGPVEGMPQYSSDQLLPDALYNMAMAELKSNLRPDSTYRAGAEWDGVWTRDVSYATYLALALTDPDGAWRSLKAKLRRDSDGRLVIVQDTGTGGAWPCSTDRVVWAMAAWEIYKATGDAEVLRVATEAIGNTLDDDMRVAWNPAMQLMHGEQSYLDWREQTYPRWMQPKDIFESMCLGTNVLFAHAFAVRDSMIAISGAESPMWRGIDHDIRNAVNNNLWMPDRGYYCSYLYGGVYPLTSGTTDNLGQALAIILGTAHGEMARSIMANTPYTPWGISSVYPQQPDIKPYHNNAVWPFVQAYWNIAAARTANLEALGRGLGAMMRAAAMFATNKELFVADSGDYLGTAVNSDAQLWSAAGMAAMFYRVIAGIDLQADAMRFSPVVPPAFKGTKRLTGLRYRKSVVNVAIHGTGTRIRRMTVGGTPSPDHVIPASAATGDTIEVDIRMADDRPEPGVINPSPQAWLPATPILAHWTDSLTNSIANYSTGLKYGIYENSDLTASVTTPWLKADRPSAFSLIDVTATDASGYTGFSCRPYEYIPDGSLITIPATAMGAPTGTRRIADSRKAKQFVELTPDKNTRLDFTVDAPAEADYFIDLRYANGAGPINTESNCAIRMLYVNGFEAGALVMPQRGVGEWLSTGYSNMLPIRLKAGPNRISIRYEISNMSPDNINDALVRYARIIRK